MPTNNSASDATATLVASAQGTIVDASPAALDLLGATLEELRAAPPGAFDARSQDPAEQTALRSSWEEAGTPDLAGESTIRRRDGTERRVRYLVTRQPAGDYLIVLVPVRGGADTAPTVYGLGDVLTAWRAAERRLVAIQEGTAEWRTVSAEISTLRAMYQAVFRSRREA
jgi:PAS domain S-box-containing protein